MNMTGRCRPEAAARASKKALHRQGSDSRSGPTPRSRVGRVLTRRTRQVLTHRARHREGLFGGPRPTLRVDRLVGFGGRILIRHCDGDQCGSGRLIAPCYGASRCALQRRLLADPSRSVGRRDWSIQVAGLVRFAGEPGQVAGGLQHGALFQPAMNAVLLRGWLSPSKLRATASPTLMPSTPAERMPPA